MPATDKLNDPIIRNARPREKPFKLADGGGMYLEVTPSGSKLWRLKYRFGGKEKRLSLGIYPEVSLRDARAKRNELRRQLAEGSDPSVVRRVAQAEAIVRSENTFEVVARRWYAMKLPGWAPAHAERVLSRLERDVFPMVGTLPIDEITPRLLLLAIRKIEARGVVETAHRALQDCGHRARVVQHCGSTLRPGRVREAVGGQSVIEHPTVYYLARQNGWSDDIQPSTSSAGAPAREGDYRLRNWSRSADGFRAYWYPPAAAQQTHTQEVNRHD